MEANMSSLMEFRLAYLRMIAHVWRNKPPAKTINEDLLNSFGRRQQWTDLAINFQPSVVASVINGAQWDPIGTAGWYGDRSNTLTLGLPLDPEAAGIKTAEARVEALAAFYYEHSTIFGRVYTGPTKPSDKSADAHLGVQQGGPHGDTEGGSHGGAVHSQLGDFDSFLEFGGVVARALSVAWSRSEFTRALLADALQAMEGWLGYRCPWSLQIKVVDVSEHFRYEDHEVAHCAKNDPTLACPRWAYIPQEARPKLNSMEYHLPKAPDDKSIWPVALTAYNNTGPQYPFTCCF